MPNSYENILAIKAKTGEFVMGSKEQVKNTLSEEFIVTFLRTVVFIPQPNNSQTVMIQPWVPPDPRFSVTLKQWEEATLFNCDPPEELVKLYLQNVTGIQLARR